MKGTRLLAACLAFGIAGLAGFSAPAEAAPEVPKNVFQWVQSSARTNFYFNKQQMHYAFNADGVIDTNVLVVPVLLTYDDIQIDDIISKRRWRGDSLEGYNALAGAAEYLRIDKAARTVTITQHDELDDTWSVLSSNKEKKVIKLDDLSEKNLDRSFYERILKYADTHAAALLASTEAKLTPEQKAKAAQIKADEEKAAAEKAAQEKKGKKHKHHKK